MKAGATHVTRWPVVRFRAKSFCQNSLFIVYYESCSVVSNSLRPHALYSPWNSLDQNIGVHSLSLVQGIFPTQGSNPGLPRCRRTLRSEPPGKPKNTGVGSLSLLQGNFSTWELNQGLLHCMTSLVAQTVKRLSTMQETWVRSLGQEDPLEKEMAIHFSTIAWKIPWTDYCLENPMDRGGW